MLTAAVVGAIVAVAVGPLVGVRVLMIGAVGTVVGRAVRSPIKNGSPGLHRTWSLRVGAFVGTAVEAVAGGAVVEAEVGGAVVEAEVGATVRAVGVAAGAAGVLAEEPTVGAVGAL